MSDKKILCIGLVCLDIINVVDKYPEEDTDSRFGEPLILLIKYSLKINTYGA